MALICHRTFLVFATLACFATSGFAQAYPGRKTDSNAGRIQNAINSLENNLDIDVPNTAIITDSQGISDGEGGSAVACNYTDDSGVLHIELDIDALDFEMTDISAQDDYANLNPAYDPLLAMIEHELLHQLLGLGSSYCDEATVERQSDLWLCGVICQAKQEGTNVSVLCAYYEWRHYGFNEVLAVRCAAAGCPQNPLDPCECCE